jgi:hypothetical protein
LVERLQSAGFQVAPSAELMAAHSPVLFFNTPADGGVQVELTRALREGMVDCPLISSDRQAENHWTDRFHALVAAAHAALADYRAQSRSDLDRTMDTLERATDAMPASITFPVTATNTTRDLAISVTTPVRSDDNAKQER